MAKNFPYFKFIAHEWLTGDIVFEDYELQGLFINVCAIYWHRDGDVTFHEICKRLKSDRLLELTDRFISVTEGVISIKFLDEQLLEAKHISKVNSENGKKGGRPKASVVQEEKPTAFISVSESEAKKSKEEEEIKKNKKQSKEDIELLLRNRAQTFKESLFNFVGEYPAEMVKAFFNYWSEPTHSGKKMRFETEKTWDVSRRLATWASRDKSFTKKTELKPNSAQAMIDQTERVAKLLNQNK